MSRDSGICVCFAVPSHMLEHLSQKGKTQRQRDVAHRSLLLGERLRGHREALATVMGAFALPAGTERRTIYDAEGSTDLPGKLLRGEGQPSVSDIDADRGYDHAGHTYDFWKTVLGRNSIDDRGMRLDASVHYSDGYDNAFWNGVEMVYGDGDGELFNSFTTCIDIVAHELTHGVTQSEAGLEYRGESGALNESFSDVFGILVKQKLAAEGPTPPTEPDWVIGRGQFTALIKGVGLRSMSDPGTAYDDDQLGGKDPQPGHMKDYVPTDADSGGVHINSGIPNRAFYLAAQGLGGPAWQKPAVVWYRALQRLRPKSSFADAARETKAAALALYGQAQADTVASAWQKVGVESDPDAP